MLFLEGVSKVVLCAYGDMLLTSKLDSMSGHGSEDGESDRAPDWNTREGGGLEIDGSVAIGGTDSTVALKSDKSPFNTCVCNQVVQKWDEHTCQCAFRPRHDVPHLLLHVAIVLRIHGLTETPIKAYAVKLAFTRLITAARNQETQGWSIVRETPWH